MKLDNKGFAITGILYTVFVLFLMIMLSILKGLNIKRTSLEKVVENNNALLEEKCENVNVTIPSTTYETPYPGKYIFKMDNGDQYETYLSKGKKITNFSSIEVINLKNSSNLTGTATIIKICSAEIK